MKNIALALLLAVMTLLAGGAAAQEYVIHFSHVVDPGTSKGQSAALFAKLVAERLAGKVRVEVFSNAVLYDDENVLNGILLNDEPRYAVMAAPSLSQFTQLSKTLQLFDLPFLFRDTDEVHKLTDSPLAAELTASLEEKNLKVLGFWDNGMKVFSVRGKQPLRRVPDDFQGKVFRIQNSDVFEEMIKALGGKTRRTPFRVVYLNLDKGIVEGQENAWSNIYSQKFYEVQDWVTVSNHSYLGYLVVTNRRFWDGSLPTAVRNQLEAILKEVTLANRRLAIEEALAARKGVEQAGRAKVVDLTPEEREQWRQATSKVEQRFAPEIGPDLLQKIHTLLGH